MKARSIAFAAALLSCAANVYPQTDVQRPPMVSAQGVVDVILPPDRAALAISITAEGADLQQASRMADSVRARMAPVLRRHRLEAIPFGAAFGENMAMRRMIPGQMDVRTSRDFIAREGLLVKFSDLRQVPAVVQELADAGVAGTMSVLYYVDERSAALRDADARALTIALERATAMARAAGGSLGTVVSLNTGSGIPQQSSYRLQNLDPSGGSVPLQPGEVLYRIVVSGTWHFDPDGR
jgi:uncharacterized protein YggE